MLQCPHGCVEGGWAGGLHPLPALTIRNPPEFCNHHPAGCCGCIRQVAAEMWRFPDRSTSIGAAINDYLANKANLDDAVVHLLFVANRFEKR